MEIYGMTGERLGNIGQTQPESETQPQWKLDLLSTPSISVRRGVARGFDAAYEDTSTLVLTSRGRHFIDIRFALGDNPTGGDSYWAFAGTSEVTFPSAGRKGERRGNGFRGGGEIVEIPCMAHCVWKHEIDSKRRNDADEGDMYLLGNGQCIEVGVSASGPTGGLQMYKEYWEAVEMDEDASCVVARTEQRTGREKGVGMVIKLGRYCQAIFGRQSVSAEAEGRAGEVHVERWYRSEEGGVWTKDWRSSTGNDEGEDVLMPSKWVCQDGRKMGDVIELLGRKWEVVECT
jgi:hypothetical protein